jgi:hypothetical protein
VGWKLLKAYLKLLKFFLLIYFRGKAGLIFQNAHCKERKRKICVFRNGIFLSRLV